MCEVPDLWLGLNILAEQPLLIESVAGLPCDGVYGAFVDLLLDCTEQQEERLTHCFLKNAAERRSQKSKLWQLILSCYFAEPHFHPHLEVAVHADGHPVSQHFFHNRLGTTQHQLGVLGS